MRIALIILIGIHGIIHLLGFLKAFGISDFNGINQPISKIFGLFWLVTFVLFIAAAILYLVHNETWWIFGFVAIFFSQILIFNYWSDAKFGTIANLIILIAALLAYLNNDFKNLIEQERVEIFEKSSKYDGTIFSSEDITGLPAIVQKWLNYSGIIGKPKISNVFLTQDLHLKFKPKQEKWNNGKAEQYFTIQPPAFNWSINTQMNPLLSVIGRDRFENGNAEMLIKLFSLIPVAHSKNDEKINQSALQRYLAELVWFPSASISNYLTWEEIDELSAKATLEYKGTKGSGIFYFNEMGQFEKFVTMRFKDSNDTGPIEWTVIANKTEERNGIRIPTECEATWTLESEQWTWLKLKIIHIEYNVKKMPVANNGYDDHISLRTL